MATYRRELHRNGTDIWDLVYVEKPMDLFVEHVQIDKSVRIELRDFLQAGSFGALKLHGLLMDMFRIGKV